MIPVPDYFRTGGFRPGEVVVQAGGYGAGKSKYYVMADAEKPVATIVDQAIVDGATWYTVSCRKDVSIWVREHGIENKEWYEHIDGKWMVHKNVFDMHEELYAYLKLSWGK
jgi:hypothetical protein